jgi:hypothetical protein
MKVLKMFLHPDNSYKSDIINISFIQSNRELEILKETINEINEDYSRIKLELVNINESGEYNDFKLKNPGYDKEYVIRITRIFH